MPRLQQPVAILEAGISVQALKRRLRKEKREDLVLIRYDGADGVQWYCFPVIGWGDILAEAKEREPVREYLRDLPPCTVVRPGEEPPHGQYSVVMENGQVAGILDLRGWAMAKPPMWGSDESGPPPKATRGFEAEPDLKAPRQVAIGEEFTLSVGLLPKSATRPGRFTIAVQTELEEFHLELRIMARGFQMLNGQRHMMSVNRKHLEQALVQVHLRATEAADPESSLTVQFYFDGQFCGSAYRDVTVYAAEVPAAGAPAEQAGGTPLVVAEVAAPADLVLTINATRSPNLFEYWLTSPHHERLNLPTAVFELQLASYKDSDELSVYIAGQVEKDLASPDRSVLRSTLEGLGRLIAAALDKQVWEAIRTVCRQVGPKASLQIISQEYQIPWELAYFDLFPDCPPHLGAQLALGRWYAPRDTNYPAAMTEIEVRQMAVVWSDYSRAIAQPRLPHAAREAEFLKERFQAETIPARRPEIHRLIDRSSTSAQVLHFACHGATYALTPGSVELALESGDPSLRPVHILGSQGTIEQERPFVFLNACQVGQAAALMQANVGFSGAFLREGSRAFVAPLWKVVDETARQFVEEFYRRTIDEGLPVGEVLRDLRRKFIAAGGAVTDPTYMAYVFYGHPNLVLRKKV